MTFFTQAIEHGTIDKKMKMSEIEFEMMLRGMVEDSNAWNQHLRKHRGNDAKIVPIFHEGQSDFEERVRKDSGKIEEPQVIQYDMHSKKFVAGCQCGQKFEIDAKNDIVKPFESKDPSLKMKEMSNYDRESSEQNAQYGQHQNSGASYNQGPGRTNQSYGGNQNNSGYNR